jgi:hypothetical protein
VEAAPVVRRVLRLAALVAVCALMAVPSVATADITAGAYPRNVVQGSVFHICCESGPRGRVFLGLARQVYDPKTLEQHIPPLKDLTEAPPDPEQDHPRSGSYGFRLPSIPSGTYAVVLVDWEGWNGLGWSGDIPSDLHVADLPSTSTSAGSIGGYSVAQAEGSGRWPLLLGAGIAGLILLAPGRSRRSGVVKRLSKPQVNEELNSQVSNTS